MVILVNPNLIAQRNDTFTTGIVYMPIGLASVAAALRDAGSDVRVIDAFALDPKHSRREGKFLLLGLDEAEVARRVPDTAEAVFIYARSLTSHAASVRIIRRIKQQHPHTPVIVLENTQAVTAGALEPISEAFYENGADYILTGEAERTAATMLEALKEPDANAAIRSVPGAGSPAFYNPPGEPIDDLDALSDPAWDLFPVHNYWNLRFAHGPQTHPRYLPMLTSRGCPYACRFCTAPATNRQQWRSRSAASVVGEMERNVKRYDVREFHFEDLNPTVSDQRIRELCKEILRRNLQITWKLASGTKVETIRDESTLNLMAEAGCRYISISPETGSKRVLALMGKPFDLPHAVRMVQRMSRLQIHSQVCFVLGFPGETDDDRRRTWRLARELTRHGADEIALFIFTPAPGAAVAVGTDRFGPKVDFSELNFSPTWRDDYKTLNRFRLRLYAAFLLWKLWYRPQTIFHQALNFLSRRFETKMEMVPYRAGVLKWLDRSAGAAADCGSTNG